MAHLGDNPTAIATCDMCLVVEGDEIPVHTSIFYVHSRVIGTMIRDLENPTNLRVPLPESRKDTDLMLEFLYGTKHKTSEFEEAIVLVKLGDKYDIQFLIKVSEDAIGGVVDNMHMNGRPVSFLLPITPSNYLEDYDLGRWLSTADRHGMKELLARCQHAVMKAVISKTISPSQCLHNLVEVHHVSPWTVGAIGMALAEWLGNLSKDTTKTCCDLAFNCSIFNIHDARRSFLEEDKPEICRSLMEIGRDGDFIGKKGLT